MYTLFLGASMRQQTGEDRSVPVFEKKSVGREFPEIANCQMAGLVLQIVQILLEFNLGAF